MKNQLLLALSIVTLLLMTACPYGSTIALSESKNSKIDTLLLGQWVGTNIRVSGDTVELNIQKFNCNEYLIGLTSIEHTPHQKAFISSENWRGFTSKVGTRELMNTTVIGKEKEEGFIFCKYQVHDTVLKISFVSDSVVKQPFATQKEMNAYFENNYNKKGFFEPDVIFTRKK